MNPTELLDKIRLKLHIGWSALRKQLEDGTLDEETIDEVFDDVLELLEKLKKMLTSPPTTPQTRSTTRGAEMPSSRVDDTDKMYHRRGV